MEYPQLITTLAETGFLRVERDDRLEDVFVGENREKGVELWEKWEKEKIKIVRIRLPYAAGKAWLYEIPRREIEQALLKNEELLFDEYQPVTL